MTSSKVTRKQMGDACEMLIAAEVTLAGIPALKMPDNWPHYDVIAQPKGAVPPLRISVKARTYKADQFVDYWGSNKFDFLAVVILPAKGHPTRRCFLIPKSVADARD